MIANYWGFHTNDSNTWRKKVHDGKVALESSWIVKEKLKERYLCRTSREYR